MRKGLSLLCLLGLFLSCLTGCGAAAGTSESDTGSVRVPETAESETQVPDDDGPIRSGTVGLQTANASMEIRIGSDGRLEVLSLKTDGHEAIGNPQILTQPALGCELTFGGAYPYRTERGSQGYRFHYTGTGLEYDLYAVSHESWSGPFEFWGTVRNGSDEPLRISDGSYFDLTVQMSSEPVATTFHKEGGCAEGWRIYSGYYAAGTGIYRTGLGRIPSGPESGRSAKFTPSEYTALSSPMTCGG